MHFSATIVIPVWNRLEALGECLANLAEHTPDAQIILMDLGSERETERRLEQFADVLDERVLLMHEPLNRGKTAAINRGISSAAADCVVVLSPMTVVTADWLSPLLQLLREHPDVGIVCPEFAEAPPKRRNRVTATGCNELHQGSFYCQAMHRSLFTAIGMFDENLDGNNWCLADFSRRAWQAGYTTARCHGSLVYTAPEQVFGSIDRRAKLQEESRRTYVARWEETASYFLCLADIRPWWSTILTGARQGDTYVITAPAAVTQSFQAEGLVRHHEGISFVPLPRLLPARRGKQMISQLLASRPELQVAIDGELLPLPAGTPCLPMSSIAAGIAAREQRLYGRDLAKEN